MWTWMSQCVSASTAVIVAVLVSGCAGSGRGCGRGMCGSSPAPVFSTAAADSPHDAVPSVSRVAEQNSSPPALKYGGQKTCPVSGEELGTMGSPIPVVVMGRTIYVCCESCAETVQRNSDRYLAKTRADSAGQ